MMRDRGYYIFNYDTINLYFTKSKYTIFECILMSYIDSCGSRSGAPCMNLAVWMEDDHEKCKGAA